MPSEATPEAETGGGEPGFCRTKAGSVFVPGVSPDFLKSHMPGFLALLLTQAWPWANTAPFPPCFLCCQKRMRGPPSLSRTDDSRHLIIITLLLLSIPSWQSWKDRKSLPIATNGKSEAFGDNLPRGPRARQWLRRCPPGSFPLPHPWFGSSTQKQQKTGFKPRLATEVVPSAGFSLLLCMTGQLSGVTDHPSLPGTWEFRDKGLWVLVLGKPG